MEITTLAETVSKESYQEGIKAFFKQYALKHDLTSQEKDEYYYMGWERIVQFVNPVIMLRRRVDVLPDGTLSPREWQSVDCYGSKEEAAGDFGETDYFNAMSRSPIHEEAIRKWKISNELYREHNTLLVEKNNLKEKYQRIYDGELRDRRLAAKASRGEAPQAVIDEIQNRLRAERDAEKTRIENRMAEILEELKGL
jgi:hypothetical protein